MSTKHSKPPSLQEKNNPLCPENVTFIPKNDIQQIVYWPPLQATQLPL